MEESENRKKDKTKAPPPIKKKGFNIDVDSFKFTLNIAAIVALIISVYQLTNFVWSNYHEIDKRMLEMDKKHDLLKLQVDFLNKKFDEADEESDKVSTKLGDIEKYVNQIENELKNGK